MNAKSLNERNIVGQATNVPRCGKLLTDGGIDGDPAKNLQPNVDFWQLADIPAGTLKKDKTYILAVTGCSSNAKRIRAYPDRATTETTSPRARSPGPATSIFSSSRSMRRRALRRTRLARQRSTCLRSTRSRRAVRPWGRSSRRWQTPRSSTEAMARTQPAASSRSRRTSMSSFTTATRRAPRRSRNQRAWSPRPATSRSRPRRRRPSPSTARSS